ncbi:ABC transporter substrate-binding protein [Pseudomonas sp. NPDC078700]|uniref:ABC transporter substrate-binding protein n=1 Tax=Pseudomonas sp. NPDC078700 TaxID=3364424 RepID=UPI0037C67C43
MKVRDLAVCVALGCASISAHAMDQLTFQLGWLPTGGDKAFIFAGINQGFYAEENLEVKVLGGRGTTDALTKIGSGAADVGSGGIGSLMMAQAEGGIPVKAVMSIYTKQPDAIFTYEGSGVSDFKSLQGKTLGVPTFSTSTTLLPLMLETNGVDPASVKQIKADPTALVPMMAQGRVDGVVIWTTNTPHVKALLKKAGKQTVVLPWAEFGLDGYGWSLFASQKLIDEKPDVVARFVRASKKALEFSLQHPGKAAADQKALVPEADGDMLEADWRATENLIDNSISQKDGLGQFEPALLQKTWEWVAKSMNYPMNKVDPEALVDRRFIKQ